MYESKRRIAAGLRWFSAVCLLAPGIALRAQNGSWNLAASGNWSTAGNWLSSTIANGAGNTATFDLPAMTVAPTVSLDTPRTLGNLVFGNASSYDMQNWSLGGGSTLALTSGSTSTVTCWRLLPGGNSAATINAPLAGSQGLTKSGTGTLWLRGNNSGLSGTLTISAGRVFNDNANGLGTMNVIITSGSYLSFWSGGTFAGNFTLNGLGGNIDGQTKNTLFADSGTGAQVILNGTVALNATADVGGSTSAASVALNGPVIGPGGLVKSGPNGSLILSGPGKSYSGSTRVNTGTLEVDAELLNSPVTNYSGTTLSGKGQIDTQAMVMGGAVVAPGGSNQPGTLTVSNMICQAGASLVFELNPLSTAEGGQINDELVVNNLVLNGSVTNEITFLPDKTPVSGRYVLLRYSGMIAGLKNLVLDPNFAAQSFQPVLDVSVPGEVALVITSGVSAQPSIPKRSGIFYSTLFAKTGEYVRIKAFGTNAAQLFLKDVNGDGHDDAVVYYTNATQLGQWWIAMGDGQSFGNPFLAVTFSNAAPGMKPLMADINGDGRQDACLFDAATGSWWAALSTGTNFATPTLFSTGNGVGSATQALADVNGDGRADALIYFSTGGLAGVWYVGVSSASGFGGFSPWLSGFNTNATGRLVGDLNGDGKSDLVAFDPSTGNWTVYLSSGTGFGAGSLWLTNFGTDASQAFLFDADRDGKADAIYLQNGSSDWWVVYSTGAAFNNNYRDRWIAGLNTAYPKEGFPAPQAELLGSLNPGAACACAVTLGDWFAIENTNKYATSIADEMDTWASWGNNYVPQTPGAIGTYDSGDPTINDIQIGLIHDAGFDFLMFDDTNGRAPWVEARIQEFILRLRAWNQNRVAGAHPLYFCVAEGASRGQTNWQQIMEQESQFAWNTYFASNQDLYYTLNARPLLVHFVPDPSYSTNFLAWSGDKTYADKFTIRWMNNTVANDSAHANAYGWPIPDANGNPPGSEVMDVMPGFWNGDLFTGRENGAFYASQWRRVLQYEPDSVWVNSWNETWEHTSVEPAWLPNRGVANPGITRWNDYYGDRMDNFYLAMTREYNELYRNHVLLDGTYLQENGSADVYCVNGSNFVYQASLPHQAPVLSVPSGFMTSFIGTVAATNFSGWSSPASLYDFDETAGDLALDSLGGLTGKLYNGATRGAGVSGPALFTDGATGFARLPQSLPGDFSLVFWFKTIASGLGENWWDGQVIIEDENSSATNGLGLTLSSGGNLSFGLDAGSITAAVESSGQVHDGLWHQIAATRDSITGELRLYVDGVLQGSAYGARGVLTPSGFLRLGAGLGMGSYLAMGLDTLQIYDQVLSPTTVAVLVNHPPAAVLLSGPVVVGGSFQARFAGLPGQNYALESTASLDPPEWQTLTNLTAPVRDHGLGVGNFEFGVSVEAGNDRFYRLSLLAP